MTSEEIKQNGDLLLKAINEADAAYEAFRVAKARMVISLACPTDGSKKPTESVIAATVDADPGIAKLRVEADRTAAIATVLKLEYQANIAVSK